MKRALLHPLLRVGVLVSLLSLTFCNKVNDYLRQWPDCEVQQYTYSLLSAYLPFLYQKRYDPSGKFVQEISVAFNGLQVLELQDLSLRSSQKKLLLVNSTNVADTTFSIEFNSIGRPLTILWTTRYDRLRLSFTYKNNRLDSIKFSNPYFQPFVCFYDNQGNVTSIKHYLKEYGQYEGTFYEYDYSRTAKSQVYFDEITAEALFPLLLLRYLDFFPELNPTNVRTRSSSGLENIYYFSRNYLYNHLIDADGKLLRYDIGVIPGEIAYHATVDWKCNNQPTRP